MPVKIEIYCGDALTVLKGMEEESVDCCITSPPYYGLRDYGVEGQIGLEATPEEYVERLVGVFREVRYVLRKDGLLFVNVGDSYAASGGGGHKEWHANPGMSNSGSRNGVPHLKTTVGCKAKDLIGIPWMLAFALRKDGWWLRQDIIWHKPNPMPESVRDRCTKAHEYVFMLSKSADYYFDADAVKEPSADPAGTNRGGSLFKASREETNDKLISARSHGGGEESLYSTGQSNKRSVWTIATKPNKDEHFATFPLALPVTCMLAGCKEGGVVLDPFAGIGTTGVGALRNNLGFVGIELNREYYEIMRGKLNRLIPTQRAL